ncbi:MAG: peptide/nickel transport system substrate-binding protein [Hyphomicrobiaceae bacterium]|jgi:peptide/nickel transport system substrate-binding protein
MTRHSTKTRTDVLFRLRTELTLSAVLCLLVTACGGSPTHFPPNHLRVAIEAAPGSVDPRRSVDAHSSRISGLVHASLARTGDDGRPIAWLATGWQRTGRLSWRFHLRRHVRFHDGTKFDADDVVATYRAVLNPDWASPKRASLGALAGVRRVDSFTVEFTLVQPDAAFMEIATIGILPAEIATKPPAPTAILPGTGPYRIESITDGFERVRLVANPHYFAGQPSIEEIEFRVVPDSVMRTLELRHGSVDFVQNAIDPDNVAWLAENEPGLAISETPYDAYQYLGVNHEHPALGDVRVRRAIAHALGRRAIVQHLLAGQARVADRLLPSHHWAHTGKVRQYRHNPKRAARLLDRAGYPDPDGPGGRPRLSMIYKTTNQELRRRIGEAFTADLAEIGIDLEMRSYEWGTFYGDVRAGAFHLYSLAWVGIADPDLYRTIFHSEQTPPAGNNRGRYRDPIMDRLTERARSAEDSVRKSIVARIQRRAARRLPYIPLWWPNQVIVASRRLVDFSPSPSGDLLGLASARLVDVTP